MAIQNRRGAYTNFDPTKMVPGEYAIVLSGDPSDNDGYAIYMCFESGVVRRLVFADQLEDALELKQDELTFDSTPTSGSGNPVTSGGIYTALAAKQNNLTFDSTPTANSNNPVTSGGIKTALGAIVWTDINNRPDINPGTGTKSTLENNAMTASGIYCHAEGRDTVATGANSHAEGFSTSATQTACHSEGRNTEASATYAHSEGDSTKASGSASHAENYTTTASGSYSHADGNHTTANHRSQHVFGEYNVVDPSTTAATAKGNYVEIVGNGTSNSAKSNARTLDWSGNEVLAGKLTVGAAPTANMDVTTKQYVDDAISGSHATYTDPDSDGNIVITLS